MSSHFEPFIEKIIIYKNANINISIEILLILSANSKPSLYPLTNNRKYFKLSDSVVFSHMGKKRCLTISQSNRVFSMVSLTNYVV